MKRVHVGVGLAIGVMAIGAVIAASRSRAVPQTVARVPASGAPLDGGDASIPAPRVASIVDAGSVQDASIDKSRSRRACARITDANAARVKEGLAEVNRKIPLEPPQRGLTLLESPPETMNRLPPWDECTLVARGAWGYSIDAIAFDLFGSEVDARWSVAWAGNDGRLFHYAVEGAALMEGMSKDVPHANCCSSSGTFVLERLKLFDFDGDGVEEAYFSRDLQFNWEPEQQIGILLSVTPDGIEPYAAVADEKTIFDMEDRTGDGRPDLFSHRAQTEECFPDHPEGKCVRIWGPVTALRSRQDGTFVEDTSLE